MTIRNFISPRDLSGQLALLEACVENAPDGTFEFEKRARTAIGDITDTLLRKTRALNLNAPSCDQIREVEAVIYGYLREANPLTFAPAEGFGRAMDSPARERVIAQSAKNLRTLQVLGIVPPGPCEFQCGRLAIPGNVYCTECDAGMRELCVALGVKL